jgi:hypothetical protein
MNNYICVGAGGTASYLFPILHRWLTSEHGDDFLLVVIDGDTITANNLARQNHAATSVGANKARALCHNVPNTMAVPEYLGANNIARLIPEDSVVLITVDSVTCRARIEDHAKTLQNVTIINAGNEEHTASVQLWVRESGDDITPPIGFLHPEITYAGDDRSEMSCEDVAELPGGGQTALANYTSANGIMLALNHRKYAPSTEIRWHEVHFDTVTGEVEPIDYRSTKAWSLFSSSPESPSSSQSPQDSSSGLATTPPARRTRNTTRPSSGPTAS